MPIRSFVMYSAADVGVTAANYSSTTMTTGSSFTASATAAANGVTVNDTDSQNNLFNDGTPANGFATPVNQLLSGTVDGTTFTNVTSNPENEYQVTDSSGNVVGFIYDMYPTNGKSFTLLQGFVSTFALVPGEAYTVVRTNGLPSPNYNTFLTCFVRGTLIETNKGPVAIENLTHGDMVKTISNGYQPIRWKGHTTVQGIGKFAPIRICAGVLGNTRDLLVSRQHRMVVSSKITDRMFDGDVLVSAIKLTELPGIFIDESVGDVEYLHLLFDKHEIIFAEGALSESLHTGPEALKGIPAEAKAEIFDLFPELQRANHDPQPALLIPSLKQQKQLVARHLANKKQLVENRPT